MVTFPNEFSVEFLGSSQIAEQGSIWAQKSGNGLTVQLPTVIVDEFLDGFPSWTAKSNGRIPEIDETGNFNVLRNP